MPTHSDGFLNNWACFRAIWTPQVPIQTLSESKRISLCDSGLMGAHFQLAAERLVGAAQPLVYYFHESRGNIQGWPRSHSWYVPDVARLISYERYECNKPVMQPHFSSASPFDYSTSKTHTSGFPCHLRHTHILQLP